jgi:hypothetical protein
MRMSIQLDQKLIDRAKTREHDKLSQAERVAANLFWRYRTKEGAAVPISVIAKVFGVSKNTLYYRCLKGYAKSYPKTHVNTAVETNEMIDKLGFQQAWDTYVTEDQAKAIDAAMRAYVRAKRR